MTRGHESIVKIHTSCRENDAKYEILCTPSNFNSQRTLISLMFSPNVRRQLRCHLVVFMYVEGEHVRDLHTYNCAQTVAYFL